jgi:Right handed beta helix region
VNIMNSHFFDIKPDPAILGTSGTAIKIIGVFPNAIAPYVKCNIGDNISSTLYDQCTFEQCNIGIDVYGNTEISIYNTNFIDDIEAPIVLSKINARKIVISNNEINSFYKQGIKISDCLNNTVFNVSFNIFSLPLTQPTGSQKLEQTAIYIKNQPAGYSGANVTYNTFTNARYGIFVNGVSRVVIANNNIHFQKPWGLMQNKLHAGIECDNSVNVTISGNVIDYLSTEAALVGTGSTIAQTLRGIILKSVSNSTISNNLITNCGRPIRCIDNLQQTYFNCNTFNGCFDSWQFQNVDISNQGGIGFPTDNKWVNYPRSINPSNQNKISGFLNSAKLYHYRNINTAVGNYIPLPNGCANLSVQPATGSGPCITQIVYEDPQALIDFVISDSVNVSNDSIYEVERARYAAYLAANDSLLTIPDYVFWHNILQNSETGIYARLLDSSYNRINLISDIAGITNFRLPEYEAKRDLLAMSLRNQTSEVDEYSFDERADDLIPLGNTPAWLSTNVVYLIRAIYDMEVDDEDLGLRMMNIRNVNVDCDFEIVEEATSRTIISKSPALLEVFNVSGQLVYKMKFESTLTLPVNTFPQFTIYQLSNSTCNKTGKWQTVR